jgi:hypothetical protein
MADDVCEAPTDGGDGPPCQHPTTEEGDSDRCWIDAHNDAETGVDPGGREFAIDADDHDAILDAAKKGASKAGCARAAGVERPSLNRYLEAHEDFRSEFTQARAQGEQRLLTGPLYEERDSPRQMDGQHARFLLSTSFDYVKTEKREHLVDDDADLQDSPADFVTYSEDEPDE